MFKWMQYVSGYMSKWFLFATVMGIGGGLSAVLLYEGIGLVGHAGNQLPIWLAPAFGGFLVCIIYWFDRDAMGFGTNRYIAAINSRSGALKKVTWISKMLATMTTLGFGGSGGVEGPMVMIGGSLANTIGKLPLIRRVIGMEDQRILTICGAAGAIGAIFRSPLGGGIFVVEVLYRSSLHYTELFPAILSSTIGYAVFSMLSSSNPLFEIPDYIPNVANLPFFIGAGVLSGLISLGFMWVFGKSVKVFRQFSMIRKIRPIIGGIFAGLIFLVIPQTSGIGLSLIQTLITDGAMPFGFLALLLVGKILATSMSIGSDGSGGLVIPALFIGAVSGNFMAGLFAGDQMGFSASLVISGMAGSLAGIANVPVAASVIIIEMVGLRVGVPATIGSIVGYMIAHSKVIYDITNEEEQSFVLGRSFRKRDRHYEDHG